MVCGCWRLKDIVCIFRIFLNKTQHFFNLVCIPDFYQQFLQSMIPRNKRESLHSKELYFIIFPWILSCLSDIFLYSCVIHSKNVIPRLWPAIISPHSAQSIKMFIYLKFIFWETWVQMMRSVMKGPPRSNKYIFMR